ncbi:hypothetical protein TGAM01_v205883 [Trichoderma gamsii]|uniref:ADF-H domain-containing protein n=1 Tax=Trichoderma gamsii TaxID=398673 RepID=A0A2P4ZLN1_9HYPO|nr:hypothetical protein TGAM01_v205883 [Trichoderma gamsii]PON25197.1 hypothetical protein TGAM01_v205883 [Trichoderma gamsii]
MSLNGLDDPKIVEAHQAGVAEPGGWFLIKYASRDEVELLDKGNGGITEIRNAVEGFDENSPLYGFLRYRRRNVIVKYLPEDCSRLIQARVAVHFTAVCERFSPYDAIYEISTAAELKDTKLSAACSLHAASGSTASSTSSRRRRLMEIAEEEEVEEQRSSKRQSIGSEPDGERPQTPGDKSTITDEVKLNSELATSPEHSKFSASNTSEVPKFTGIHDRPTSPTKSIDTTDSRSDIYSYYPTGKPKVKLAPRPKADITIRPQVAGNFRPVSSLPVGYKLFGKGGKKSKSKDADSASLIQEETPEMEPIADAARASNDALGISGDTSRPSTATGAETLSVPAVPAKPTITPEKARLMKAMKLREKKKKQQELLKQQSAEGAIPGAEEKVMVLRGGEDPDFEHSSHIHDDDDDDDEEEEDEEDEIQKSEEIDDRAASISHADSGVVLSNFSSLSPLAQIDEVSEETARSESLAQSSTVASSEHDESTPASSLSDSTDETVHGAVTASKPGVVDVGKSEAKEGKITSSSSPSLSSAAAAASLPEEKKSSAVSTRDNAISVASESTTAIAAEEATGAANKGSAKPENEKEKKGIAEPISQFSAHIPTSKAPPAASLKGMGSGAAEIPLSDTPGDVAQAANKGELPPVKAAPLPSGSKLSTQDLVDTAESAAKTTVATTPLMDRQPEDPSSAAQESSPAAETANEAAATPDEPKAGSKPSASSPPPIQTDRTTEPKQQAAAEKHDDRDAAAAAAAHASKEATQRGDATVQNDNKPMSATKSPPTPVFPSATIANGPLGARAPQAHTVRTVSNPVRGNYIAPTDVTQSTARSLSSGAAFLHKITQQQSASLATMKPTVGSSISQRIKALEKLSATSGDQARPESRERPQSTFFAVQKRDTSRPPSVMDRTKSLKGRAASPTPSQDEFPLPLDTGRVRLQRSGSVVSRVSMFEPLVAPSSANSLAPGPQSRGRPESIAVTPRMLRDPSLASRQDASEYGYQQQQFAGDHDDSGRRSRSLERDGEDDMGRRSSLNTVKGFFKDPRKSVTVSTNMRQTIVSRTTTQSPSSRRSITLDRDNLANSSVTEDSYSGDEKDRKSSRAGRFMRKLSNFSTGSSKSKTSSVEDSINTTATSITTAASTAAPTQARKVAPPASSGDAAIVSDLGDVNVQFPDSLLWKRRNLCLDAQGFIILAAGTQSGRAVVGPKRYFLGEFRQPYTPDVEVQELPNSVVLDFVEGTAIQLACEDRTGQLNVLHVLQAAHANYSR